MEAPSPTEIDHLIGLYRRGDHAQVLADGAALAERFPGALAVHNLLGAANASLGRFEAAITCYRRALIVDPGAAAIHNNIGVALRASGQVEPAIASYRKALLLRPDYADAHNNLGNALRELGQTEEAIASFRVAIRLEPHHVDALYNLANMAAEAGRCDEAITAYDQVLAVRPDHAATRAHRLHQQSQICDWPAIKADAALIPQLGVVGDAVSPFALLALDDNPERHRLRAEKYVAALFSGPVRATFTPPEQRPKRLRIGYFSADFHDHATMQLMAGLFEQHDRSRFDIHAYSYGPDRDDAMRRRLRAAVDLFRDVRSLGDKDIAECARADGIDIAVDLKGLTHGARLGIFAHGTAPLQLSYLGYPGPLGAPFIDYLIADRTVIPDSERAYYGEHILYLRHSYQVNDDRRPIDETMTMRAQAGLPATGFVFCCFNASYKIEPAVFDIWMRLLAQVEGSVLWMLAGNPIAIGQLRAEAAKCGVAPERLVFADPLPAAGHLARLRLADLFLDTFSCNAHTTASDALWAGLPLLTLPGRSFAARVGASLLGAIGLPEMIASSREDYEELALSLARDPARLRNIRTRLAANRRKRPLFRTDLTTAQIERAYEAIHARWRAGTPLGDIDIAHIAPSRGPGSDQVDSDQKFRARRFTSRPGRC